LLAILFVGAAALVTLGSRPFFEGRAPLAFFCIATMLAAGYGGLGAGLLATALSTSIILALFENATFVLAMAQTSLILFIIIGVVASIIMGKLYRANTALTQARDELDRTNRTLAQHTAALMQSNEELHRFAYAFAHDLRSPLRSISAFTSLSVQRNTAKLDDVSKEHARFIIDGTERMEAMIKGLLEYAAAVDDHADAFSTDTHTIVNRVLQDHQHAITTTGAVINLDPLPWVRMHPEHLTQVFSNLLGNALKYRSLQPVISITAADHGNDWLFCVKDNGIGFSMTHADTVFGMFKRRQRRRVRRTRDRIGIVQSRHHTPRGDDPRRGSTRQRRSILFHVAQRR
jgi:signal transduction histidine kinase